MQLYRYKGFVEEPKKMNLSLPGSVVDAFRSLISSDRVGGKDHWELATVAFLLLLETSEQVRRAYRDAVRSADVHDAFPELVQRARSGEIRALRDEANAATRPRVGHVPRSVKKAVGKDAHPKQ